MTSRHGVRHSTGCITRGLRVRSGRSLAESNHASVEHERGGGGHFSPRLPCIARCFASAALRSLPFFFSAANLRPERTSGVTRRRIQRSSFDFRQLRGRGQNCFVIGEKILKLGIVNPLPVPPQVRISFPSIPPTCSHLLPAERFPRRSIRRRCDATLDRARHAKSIAFPPDTVRR